MFLVAASGDHDIPAGIKLWIDEILLPFWQGREEKLKEIRNVLEEWWWNYVCDAVGVPYGTRGDQVPAEKQEQWMALWELFSKQVTSTNSVGPEKTVIPLPIPEETLVYALQRVQKITVCQGWEKVERAHSPVPAIEAVT